MALVPTIPDALTIGATAVDRVYQGPEQIWPEIELGAPDSYASLAGWWDGYGVAGSGNGTTPTEWPATFGTALPILGIGGVVDLAPTGIGTPAMRLDSIPESGGYYSAQAVEAGKFCQSGVIMLRYDSTATNNYQHCVGAAVADYGPSIRYRSTERIEGTVSNVGGGVTVLNQYKDIWFALGWVYSASQVWRLSSQGQTGESTHSRSATPALGLGYRTNSTATGMAGWVSQCAVFDEEMSFDTLAEIQAWMTANPSGRP